MPSAEVYKLADADNPTDAMLKVLGDLSRISVGGARVLVWPYIRPRKTKGGIILTDKEVKEDIWQAASGYVVKLGPLAFKDDAAQNITFGGFAVEPGDWVTFSPGEGKRIQVNGVDLRLFEDSTIHMKIDDPEMVTHRQ